MTHPDPLASTRLIKRVCVAVAFTGWIRHSEDQSRLKQKGPSAFSVFHYCNDAKVMSKTLAGANMLKEQEVALRDFFFFLRFS